MSVGLLDDLRDGIEVHLAPLTVDQYQQMIRDGILHDGEPIELIQGALLYKDRRDETGGIMTHGPRHLRTLNKLMAFLSQWVSARPIFLQVQGPIVVSATSEPEPDCCLVRGTPDDYANDVPQAADVLAVFEVAYSSLQSDRRTKQRLYATAGIPVYVIINLQDNLIEILSNPSTADARYLTHAEYQPSETVSLELGQNGPLSFSGADLL
jgi:Uma2 family endonuclease